jgi:S1-C subfamily serine protease
MKRHLLSVVLLLVLQVAAFGQAKSVSDCVVSVSMSNGNGGSGTSVYAEGHGVIITAKHVVTSAEKGEITFRSGKKYKALVVATDPRSDLAALLFDRDEDTPRVAIGKENPSQGAKLWKVGFPADRSSPSSPSVLTGQCVSADSELQTTTPVYSGDSGGGWFNESGYFVGAVTGYKNKDHSQAYGPSAAQINVFMEKTCFPILRRRAAPQVIINQLPAAPAPAGPVVPMPVPAQPNTDLSAILAQLKALNDKIDNVAKTPGPAGPKGDTGPPGPAAPTLDIKAVQEELAKLGFTIDIVDGSGNVVQSQKVRLGGVVKLQLTPLVKK